MTAPARGALEWPRLGRFAFNRVAHPLRVEQNGLLRSILRLVVDVLADGFREVRRRVPPAAIPGQKLRLVLGPELPVLLCYLYGRSEQSFFDVDLTSG